MKRGFTTHTCSLPTTFSNPQHTPYCAPTSLMRICWSSLSADVSGAGAAQDDRCFWYPAKERSSCGEAQRYKWTPQAGRQKPAVHLCLQLPDSSSFHFFYLRQHLR